MAESQNGWVTLSQSDCVTYTMPIKGNPRRLTVAPSFAGFVLAWLFLWLHRRIEKCNLDNVVDEGGYNFRPIAGTSVYSNHASGTAFDYNWRKHPYGAVGTFRYYIRFPFGKVRRALAEYFIRRKLKRMGHVLKWGGEYHGTKDEMHFEISDVNGTEANVYRLAKRLAGTKIGKDLLRANPHVRLRF